MAKRNFGIEIEFTGVSRGTASAILAEFFQTTTEKVSEKRTKIVDNLGRDWFITNDRSIKPQVSSTNLDTSYFSEEDFGTYRVELISPVLDYTELVLLGSIVSRLVAKGAVVNDTCGVHIHLDFMHDVKAIKRIVNLMYTSSNMLYTALSIPINRLKYCRKYASNLVQRINSVDSDNIVDIRDAWYAQYPSDEREVKRNRTRYYGVNFHSAFKSNTLEFRLFNATFDIVVIKAYLDLCFTISEYGLNSKVAPVISTKVDFTVKDFTEWLQALGFPQDRGISALCIGLTKSSLSSESAV